MSVKRLLDEFISFWIGLYAYAMKGDMELMLAKVRSPGYVLYQVHRILIPNYRFDLHISVCVG
jgi:hypothetical protein